MATTKSAPSPQHIAVFGAGSWGTALAMSLVEQGHRTTLWARRPEAVQAMRETRRNAPYLPDAELPPALRLSHDLEAVAANHSLWVVATPSHAVRPLAQQLAPYAAPATIVVSVAKGIENETLLTMTDVLKETLPTVPPQQLVALYGPSHAEEVANRRPTTLVAAAPSAAVAEVVQGVFMRPRLRIYANDDVRGVEIGGSVKNVLAIAAGIGDGIGYGDNAKAALITRGIAEIQRLGIALGAQPRTFTGLTGMGDLVVTCMSSHSRNRHVGEQIGRGRALDDITSTMQMVAEGIRTTESTYQLAQRENIEMPITEAVHAVLFEQKDPTVAVEELMTRSAKHEDWLPDELQQAVGNAPQ
ncbi:MAG: NAD(P)H-dependent glycerol-3-phosphate dehydrogenase [Bacteroidetes bacterium]|nr:NAD(P)H-dependent glycerol-3-phosphate dehydrogenase [Bacteroidota bacterium]